jgi:hypothetical protein
MSDPVIHADSPDHRTGSWGQLFVVVWKVNTTMEGVTALRQGVTQLGKKNPQGIGLLTVVEANAPMPSSEARDAIATFLREAGSFINASAVIFEGEGFRAAAVRSVVTGLTMLAKQPYPHKVFAGITEAAAWLAPKVAGGTIEPASMIQAVGSLRKKAS